MNRLFGSPPARDQGQLEMDQPVTLQASRLRITEEPIEAGHRLRPARIRIDRFTGGVVDGGLFDEEPVYGGRTRLRLEIRSPEPGETGLLLLLLKDLLTSDLVLGGTGSVGRGLAAGSASIQLPNDDAVWKLEPQLAADDSTAQILNRKVQEFHHAPALAGVLP